MEYKIHYELETSALEEKFSVTRHFIVVSHDRETENENTIYKNIQEQFVGNNAKLESYLALQGDEPEVDNQCSFCSQIISSFQTLVNKHSVFKH